MTNQLTRAWLAVLALAAIGALAACGNDDDDQAPDGWSTFSEPEFRGVVKDEWVYATLDAGTLTDDLDDAFEDLSDIARDGLIDALSSADLQDTLFAFIDPLNEDFASNINILSCGSGGLVPVEPDVFIGSYAAGGIDAEELREVAVLGEDSWLYQVHLSPAFDTYQIPFRAGGDCQSVATLTVDGGEDHFIEDFLVFIDHLRLND